METTLVSLQIVSAIVNELFAQPQTAGKGNVNSSAHLSIRQGYVWIEGLSSEVWSVVSYRCITMPSEAARTFG